MRGPKGETIMKKTNRTTVRRPRPCPILALDPAALSAWLSEVK